MSPVDLKESSANDVISILRQQPAKYYWSFCGVLLTLCTAVVGATWAIAMMRSEIDHSKQLGDVNVRLSKAEAELAAANQIVTYQRQLLSVKSQEFTSAQKTISSLQESLSEKDRRLFLAEGCESIRAEARTLFARAEKIARDLPAAEGLAAEKMEGEFGVLEGKVAVYNEQLRACAGRK